LQEVWEGYEFLKQYRQCDVHTALNRLFVAPGAPIRERLAREGRLSGGVGDFSPRSNEYEFLDRRVGALLSILRVAIFPVFPSWYSSIKEFRRLRAEGKFSQDQAAANDRMAQLRLFRRGVDRVVEDCFEEAFRYVSGSSGRDTDMLAFARRVKEDVHRQTESLAHLNSCDECLCQAQGMR
jgi:hypothetical protein